MNDKSPLTPAAGTDRQRQAGPDDAHPAAGDLNTDGSVGTDAQGGDRIHPLHSVSVTPAKHPHQAAYVGQSLLRDGDKVYGGTLCEARRADPEEANRAARWIADAWNATGHLRSGGGDAGV